MQRLALAFTIVIILGATIVTASLLPHFLLRPIVSNSRPNRAFGSLGRIPMTGWQIPANTLISTTYTANDTLSTFIGGQLTVVPYQIQSGTSTTLGLYVNGRLVSQRTYDYDSRPNGPSASIQASVIGKIDNGRANFTNVGLGYSASVLDLRNTLPAGTVLTLTILVNNPIWVQIDHSAPVHSYQSGQGTNPLPQSIVPGTGNPTQYTLAVYFESN